jgi:ribosomal protein L37AE/L43A
MQLTDPIKKSPQQRAALRVCMHCEWIFHKNDASEIGGCPKCDWPSYGARFVYGDRAYRYALTQKPWYDRNMAEYSYKLDKEIREARAARKPKSIFSKTLNSLLGVKNVS